MRPGFVVTALRNPVARIGVALTTASALLFLFLVGGVLGSVVDGLVHPDASYIGASGGVSALFGAALRFAIHRRNLWPVAAVWLIANAVAGQSGLLAGDAEVAWVAHAAGFLLGLALFPLLDRRV